MIPAKSVGDVTYSPTFLRDTRDALQRQQEFATQIGNLPVATLFSHCVNALELYAQELENKDNFYLPPTTEIEFENNPKPNA